jgi:hypothetical protein
MKPIHIFFIVYVFSALSALGEKSDVWIKSETVNGTTHSFWFDWNHLPSMMHWEPATEPLPVNLGSLVAKAGNFVRDNNHLTNQLAIQSISLKRLPLLEPEAKLREYSDADISNQWYVETEFYVSESDIPPTTAPEPKYAIAFLDGTFASERTNLAISKLKPAGASVPKSHPDYFPDAFAYNHAVEKLLNPQLPLSTVLWNGNADQFPLDFPAQIAHARQALLDSNHEVTDLQIDQIEMTPFNCDVQQAHGLKCTPYSQHWLIGFTFQSLPNTRKGYCVYLLLDGTFIYITK